ncbi:MAG: alpha/beta hydrolase [Opitutaceae bacterium]|nr:alpha/beta hydrolase [Opitutaceae bacterium]
MPDLSLVPALSWYAMLHAAPLRPLHTLVRTAQERRHPPRAAAYLPAQRRAENDVIARGLADPSRRATVLREPGRGRTPTIVLGGFVPDSGEQIFLLRRFLLQAGDLYTLVYPRDGFSLDLLCAQLDDLLGGLADAGQPPVIFGVSFGAGLALEWLRRQRASGATPPIAGLVMVSPVACVADVVAPGGGKPATLLGRALRPYLDPAAPAGEAAVERSRTVFARMFEAGAQNKAALRQLMTLPELERLRASVAGAIRDITARGARERVSALTAMRAPTEYFMPALLPLTPAPTLVLFAEREEDVLDPRAPSLFAFRHAQRAYFPRGAVRDVVAGKGGSPVQHASLIFHVFEFLPPLQAFYGRLRAKLPLAA